MEKSQLFTSKEWQTQQKATNKRERKWKKYKVVDRYRAWCYILVEQMLNEKLQEVWKWAVRGQKIRDRSRRRQPDRNCSHRHNICLHKMVIKERRSVWSTAVWIWRTDFCIIIFQVGKKKFSKKSSLAICRKCFRSFRSRKSRMYTKNCRWMRHWMQPISILWRWSMSIWNLSAWWCVRTVSGNFCQKKRSEASGRTGFRGCRHFWKERWKPGKSKRWILRWQPFP